MRATQPGIIYYLLPIYDLLFIRHVRINQKIFLNVPHKAGII